MATHPADIVISTANPAGICAAIAAACRRSDWETFFPFGDFGRWC
jgi:hypothetical protein